MKMVGITGLLVSYCGIFYFTGKGMDVAKTSPEHLRVAQLEQELFTLQNLGCVSARHTGKSKYQRESLEKDIQPDLPIECAEADVRQEEMNTLMQSIPYLEGEKQKEVYFNHALGFAVGGVPLFLLTYAVGSLAVQRRREEAGERKI